MQGAMNWAAFGNVQKPGALHLGELTVELYLALNVVQLSDPGFATRAVCGVDVPMAQPHRDVAQRPALALGVHANRDGGAGAEAGQEQVIGCGAAVGTADSGWLVGDHLMAASGDALAVRARIGLGHDHRIAECPALCHTDTFLRKAAQRSLLAVGMCLLTWELWDTPTGTGHYPSILRVAATAVGSAATAAGK